jgi:hypothetical protein
MNWHRHLELVPHYLANLVLVLLAVGALRRVAGDPGTPVELAAVVAPDGSTSRNRSNSGTSNSRQNLAAAL